MYGKSNSCLIFNAGGGLIGAIAILLMIVVL